MRFYHLEQVRFSAKDVFVDCGANVGELGVWALQQGLEYHAIDPDECAAQACDMNVFDGAPKTHRVGLTAENRPMIFYKKTATADSSLIKPPGVSEPHQITGTRLSDLCASLGISRIKLLKVEAEGAEPEVLAGASKIIPKTEYITVDCSPERGVEQKHTLIEAVNYLMPRGFELIATMLGRRMTLLFHNQAFGASVADRYVEKDG